MPRGPLPYVGGKTRLAREIIALFPKHTTYVEVFGGGGQVLFRKPPSDVEVYNDIDGDLVNFFRVCQWHHEELVRCLRFSLISRAWHKIYKSTPPESLTDVQRAARFFYLQKNSFGGLIRTQQFHYGVTHPPNFNPKRIPEILDSAHRRLQGVQIESLPYEQLLAKYDRETTLFYLDPPYWKRKLYRFNFSEQDFVLLAERLASLKGRFILSLNDDPEVRRIFSAFHIGETSIIYTAKSKTHARFQELLITNFNPERSNID